MVRAPRKAAVKTSAHTAAPSTSSDTAAVRKKTSARPAVKEAPASQIIKDLDGIQKAFDEALSAFRLRVKNHLASVQRSLKRPTSSPKIKLKDVSKLIASLKLKPSRGRMKDLTRIAKLAKILDDAISVE